MEDIKETTEETKEVQKTEEKHTKTEVVEKAEVKPKALNITLSDNDASILLEALDKYIRSLQETKRSVNRIVENQEFNRTLDSKIVIADALRFLINKGLVIVDKSKKIYSTSDEGVVLKPEIDSPVIVGNTPKVKVSPVKPAETKVSKVSED